MVTHIATNEPDVRYAGYSKGRTVDAMRVLVRDTDARVLQWEQHVTILVSSRVAAIMRRIDPAGPTPAPQRRYPIRARRHGTAPQPLE